MGLVTRSLSAVYPTMRPSAPSSFGLLGRRRMSLTWSPPSSEAEASRRGLSRRCLPGARELGLSHATLVCHVDNTASRRVAEKCAFALVSREGDELHFRRTVP